LAEAISEGKADANTRGCHWLKKEISIRDEKLDAMDDGS